jgi:hypothetical protein
VFYATNFWDTTPGAGRRKGRQGERGRDHSAASRQQSIASSQSLASSQPPGVGGVRGYNSGVSRERWAQAGITVQFLIVMRTLGEIFRLRHFHGASFSVAAAMPYAGGALIAVCCCWAGVILYFFRRYTLSAWVALGTVVGLIVYKIAVMGW